MITKDKEQYEQVIAEIENLSQDISRIAQLKSHKYNYNYIISVIRQWEKNGGQRLIRLWDLPDYYKIKFHTSFNPILLKALEEMRLSQGLDTTKRMGGTNFYLVEDYLNGKVSSLTLLTLKRIISCLERNEIYFPINHLERNIISIKPGKGSGAMALDGFPIDLADERWAPIFGIILDTHLQREFSFTTKDNNLASDVAGYLMDVGIITTIKKKINHVIKGHNVVRDILSVSGIVVNQRQMVSNNCLPWWIFKTSAKYRAILLAKFLDTEGSVDARKRMIRITQCVKIDVGQEEQDYISQNCTETIIKPSQVSSKLLFLHKMNQSLQQKVISNPPLILVSIQLLLRKGGINSGLYPLRLVVDSQNNTSALWNLHIQSNGDIRKFYDFCGKYISILYKRERIEEIIKKAKVCAIPAGLRKIFYLAHADKLEQENGCFTVKDVIKATGKCGKTVYDEIGLMESGGLICSFQKKGREKLRKLTTMGRKILEERKFNLEEYNQLLL